MERKATGYISFVRGENPYTFPYRIWPNEFAIENTFEKNEEPTVQLNGKRLVQNLEILSLYLTKMGEIQQKGYDYIISRLYEGEFSGNTKLKRTIKFENIFLLQNL